MKLIGALCFFIFTYWAAAYAHESDLIRHCVEEGTLKTWNGEYNFECKAIKKQSYNVEY